MNINDYSNEKDYVRFSQHFTLEKDLQTLKGLIIAIESDGVINNEEIAGINHWIQSKKVYRNHPIYGKLLRYLQEAISDNFLSEVERSEIINQCDSFTSDNRYFTAITSSLQVLSGILKGISIDNSINDDEVNFLDAWLEENSFLKNTWPYDEVYTLITHVLSDGIVSDQEKNDILNFCKSVIGENPISTDNSALIQYLKINFYQIDPEIVIPDNQFVITGISNKFKRKEIIDRIVSKGGKAVSSVSSLVNYLVVCADKNECWAFSSYGRKIEEAINLRKSGTNLVIIHENDLYDVLN